MDTLFSSVDKDNNYEMKIDIDQLYEKKQKSDMTKLDLYNKLLNRIHTKIKTTSRLHHNQQWCWFVIPEVMIGSPRYNQGECISYLIDKLFDNGFNIKYIDPNCLLISWNHWVPSYVRNEIKKKTGIIVDEYGNEKNEGSNNNQEIFMNKQNKFEKKETSNSNKQNFKSTNTYTPLGNLVYPNNLVNKLNSNLNN